MPGSESIETGMKTWGYLVAIKSKLEVKPQAIQLALEECFFNEAIDIHAMGEIETYPEVELNNE